MKDSVQMRLWIDGQCLQTASRFRGIGRYVMDFIGAIADNHPEVDLSISFNAAMPSEALIAREAVRFLVRPANIHVWHGAAQAGEAIEGYTPQRRLSELAISHHVNCLAPDIALSASPFEGSVDIAVPLLPERGCVIPTTSIFYDAIPYRYKRYLDTKLMRDYYQRRLNSYTGFADNLCISEFSTSELKSIHNSISAVNISAGISNEFIQIEREAKEVKQGLGEFILYVGSLVGHKNVNAVIESFVHIDGILPANGLKLVIAGDVQSSLLNSVKASWGRLGLSSERLICLGHVSDAELVSLYKQAKVLVQPSFMEGFGLTALEAIHCGTPVVAARAGALPEVVGIDDLLFDPSSPKELASVIARLLDNPGWSRDLQKQMRMHAEQFTWKRSAKTAIERLSKLDRRDTGRDVLSSRSQIAPLIDLHGLDTAVAARTLALAEPLSSQRRLLIDATFTGLVTHKTGIQRVVKKICESIANDQVRSVEQIQFVLCDDPSGWFAMDGRTLERPEKEPANKVVIGSDTLLMLDSSWHLFELHQPHLRACRLRGGEVITCLYDTVPIRSAAFCDPNMPVMFSKWLRSALMYSTGFVCISRAVADELLALLEAIEFPRRMNVGYWQLGADFSGASAAGETVGTLATSPRPRFLMVGTLEPRKGHRVALDAFETLWSDGVDAELVLVGKTGWEVTHLVERIRNHPEYGKRLQWHETVNDDELGRLYAQCDALIAASFAEGFGLPIVEAGHFGKPVLASDIPVFREVAKGTSVAHFFTVGDPAALADAVNQFIRSNDKADPSMSGGHWPSWAESAAQLKEVVLGQNWYRTYEPDAQNSRGSITDIGHTQMSGQLDETQRAHRLDVVEGPYPTDDGRTRKIVVAATNLTDKVWSSLGSANEGGVTLSYHLLDRAGRDLQVKNAYTPIPFVLAPGDTIYMALKVPTDLVEQGASFADIELVQGNSNWLGTPLRVSL
ncbi:glycosyltransferase family 4 protein [Phyllobacterium endophyticum]|nr:glycosyltransferase family 1 protein [Phyllobacterium endophyticum]MBB3234977.1 glycosyltransferase involved in cell wall biosynthesis [Phyllobacterium endophyticum]